MSSPLDTTAVGNGTHCERSPFSNNLNDSLPKLRVALLTNEVPPYRVAKYRDLAATPGWDFRVFTCVDRERHRLWNVSHDLPFTTRRSYSLSYVREIRHDHGHFVDQHEVHLPIGLVWDMWRFNPDVIISGEFGARTLIASLYSWLRRRPLLVRFEGTPHTESDLTRAQRCVRRIIRHVPKAYLVNGREGRRYIECLGAAGAQVFEVGEGIETDLFDAQLSADERRALRAKLGIHGYCYLFCGALVPRKGLDQLLDAWIVLTKSIDVEVTLLIVGDGADRRRLEQRIADAKLTNVRMVKHVQRTELPPIYQAADVFVMPTLFDCWAMVVEEAMASGLPVINSIYNGSAERIIEGETGWLVDPLDPADMVAKLRMALEARDRKEAMSNIIRKSSAAMSIPAAAERIRQAVNAIRPPENGNSNVVGEPDVLASSLNERDMRGLPQ
jgi:glycosyltransferase involved in cell wall biosynthesis